jgi:hypothetical protein
MWDKRLILLAIHERAIPVAHASTKTKRGMPELCGLWGRRWQLSVRFCDFAIARCHILRRNAVSILARMLGPSVLYAARRQNSDSSLHPAISLAPQLQRPVSHGPPEQLRVGQGPGVTADAELRLAALLRFGCPRWLPKVGGHVCAGTVLMFSNHMIALSIRQCGRGPCSRGALRQLLYPSI